MSPHARKSRRGASPPRCRSGAITFAAADHSRQSSGRRWAEADDRQWAGSDGRRQSITQSASTRPPSSRSTTVTPTRQNRQGYKTEPPSSPRRFMSAWAAWGVGHGLRVVSGGLPCSGVIWASNIATAGPRMRCFGRIADSSVHRHYRDLEASGSRDPAGRRIDKLRRPRVLRRVDPVDAVPGRCHASFSCP